jgi:hypothetical protein
MFNLFVKFLDSIPPGGLVAYAMISGRVSWRDFIFQFLLLQTVLNTTANILQHFYDLPNLYLYHTNCILSFLILSGYFMELLSFRFARPVLLLVIGLFLVFVVIDIIFWEGLDSFNSNSYSVASFIIIAYCLLYYYQKLTNPATMSIFKSRDFYYVTGLLTYFTSCFFIFVSYRKLTQENVANLGLVWRIHNVVFLIMCLYILIGFLCKPSPQKYNLL